MNHRTTLLILSVAIAGALAAACHRNDDQAAADAAANATPADTTPATGAMAAAATYPGTTPMADTTGALANGPILDSTFYQEAIAGGRKEIAAATMASTTAQDAGVKAFADMLVKDHTALNQQVMDASGMADAATPAPDATATADLQGKTGADFDRAFIDKMVADHQATIALFENAAANASTDQAKSLAQGALPKLREHLQTAQDLQAKLGAT